MDGQRQQLGREVDEMEGLEDALTFIDSHILQQSDDDDDEEEDVEEKQLEKCEVVREKFVIKEELEIGKTEFLEQDLSLHGAEYEGSSQATDDTFDAPSLKTEPTESNFESSQQSSWPGVKTGVAPHRSCSEERLEVRRSNSNSKMDLSSNEDLKGEPAEYNMGKTEPEKLKIFVKTVSESSTKSRIFQLTVKPDCSLRKVRTGVAGVLKVAPEDIVLTTKGRRRRLEDSALIKEIQDCVLVACIL